jgi:hypothetical protein
MLLFNRYVFALSMLLFALSASAVSLFEIKDESGNPVLIVDPEGLTVMTWDYTKGSKALGDTLMVISSKSIKAHIKSNGKALSRTFAVTTTSSKGQINVLDVNTTSTAMRETSGTEYSNFSPDNIFLGAEAGKSITDGKYNQFFGNYSGYSTKGDYDFQDPEKGSYNLFLGHESGYLNVSGKRNILLGYQSGYSMQSASNNVLIGDKSGYYSTASSNTFVGNNSGMNNTTGFFNTFLGDNSGYQNGAGHSNTYLGNYSATINIGGDLNTAVGKGSGSRENGSRNTFVGVEAGSNYYATSSDNVYLGYASGYGNYGEANVFIGAGSGSHHDNAYNSNRLFIANSDTNTPLIFGHFPNQQIALNADSVKVRALVSGSGNAVYRNATTGLLVASSSDIRLKENVSPLKGSLEKVSNLQGVNFSWKSDDKHQNKIGFIAQEVEKIIPEVVFTNEADGFKGINYAEITAVLVEAVKELNKENKELKEKVSEIEALRAEIDIIKKQISGSKPK